MILAKGVLYDSKEQEKILGRLETELEETLSGPALEPEWVLSACDALGRNMEAGVYDEIAAGLGLEQAGEAVRQAAGMLRREVLEYRLQAELGEDWQRPRLLCPPGGEPLEKRLLPLGVLFHIAAGNVEALPAYSVAEGLLTGNINLLKLPQADNGLSLALLEELIRLEPRLRDFIYVFDTPSSDLAALKRMADLADGVVVWGGDAAVSAARSLAKPGTRLIEWGHKLGFAYVSGEPKETELSALAEHIMETKQLLCSSCQVIYLDTEDLQKARRFCERFLPLLEQAAARHRSEDIGTVAELTLRRYTARLEKLVSGADSDGLYEGTGCSLRLKEDRGLELSPMFGNCLVKCLPRKEILPVLRKSKGYLQTAGLLCPEEEREALANLLLRTGVSRVTSPEAMSRPGPCAAHDGEFPLRRCLRAADVAFKTGKN